MEQRGHPVRLSAEREQRPNLFFLRSEHASPAGGQDVRAPSGQDSKAAQGHLCRSL
jgi:hypothetical protein